MEGFEKLGRALAALRNTKGMRQREVAEALGVRKSSVSRLEAEGVNPRIATLKRYLAAIGCTFDDLLRSLRTLEAGETEDTPDEGDSADGPPSIERDVAWLLRSHAAMGDELRLLRDEFHRFRTDVSTRMLRDAAERQRERSASREKKENGPNESGD